MVMMEPRTSAMPSAGELLAWWDEADDRAVRATLVPMLRRVMHEVVVEDRMVRDYLFSLRAGDRHLAAILESGSERVVAAYAQVILRRMREGRGLARYAVRHLARRGEGQPLLQGVVVSDRFGLSDILTVLEAFPDRELRIRALPRLAHLACLPPLQNDELRACLAHPDAAVRELARSRWEREQRGPVELVAWDEALSAWGLSERSVDEIVAAADVWGQQVVDAHGEWLHTLSGTRAPIAPTPRAARQTVACTVRQEWQGERVRFWAGPAPRQSRPRLVVTFRDAQGCIVDMTELRPIRYDGGAACFEGWLVGRREGATTADVKVRFDR